MTGYDRYLEKMRVAGAPQDVPAVPEGENPEAQRRLVEKLAIGGRPEWADQNIPAEKRVGDYLAVHARAGTGWDDAAAGLKGLGLAEPEALRPQFDLEKKRAEYGGKEEHQLDTMGYVGRRSIPFVSSAFNWNETREYGHAIERYRDGKASADDLDLIAKVERIQQIDRRRGAADATLSDLARVPAMLGEGYAAGKAVQGLGLTGAGTLPAAGRLAVQTTAMPSMYLERGAQNQLANPQDNAAQNYGSAWTLGAIQTAVLGRLGRPGANLVGRTGGGMAEMQVADTAASGLDDVVKEVSGKTLGLSTRYGLVGSTLRNDDDAGKHAVAQTVTFGVFAKLHGRDPQPVLDAYKDAMDAGARKVRSQQAVAQDLVDATRPLVDHLRENPNPDPADLQNLAAAQPKGPKRDFAQAVVDAVAAPGRPRSAEEAAQRILDARPDLAEPVARPPARPEDAPNGAPSPTAAATPTTPQDHLELATQDRNKADVRLAEAERKVRAANERATLLYPLTRDGQDARRRAQAEYAAATTELRAARRERKAIQKRLDDARDAVMRMPAAAKPPVEAAPENRPQNGHDDRFEPPPGPETAKYAPPLAPAESRPEVPSAGDRPSEHAPAPGDRLRLGAALRNEAAARAVEAVNAGKPAVYVDMDVDNMLGLDRHVGTPAATAHVAAMRDIIREELARTGADVGVFRHAGHERGDEHSAVVIGATKQQVDTALKAADARIVKYVSENGLAAVQRAKFGENGEPKKPGPRRPGITTFAEPFQPGRSAAATFAEAEAGTEGAKARRAGAGLGLRKLGPPHPEPARLTPEQKAERLAQLRERQAGRPPVPAKVVDTTQARSPFERVIPGERTVNPVTEAATQRAESEFQRLEASAQDALSPAGQRAERKAQAGSLEQQRTQAAIRAEKQEAGEPRTGWRAVPPEEAAAGSLLTPEDRAVIEARRSKLPAKEREELKGLSPREQVDREVENIHAAIAAEKRIPVEEMTDVRAELRRRGLTAKAADARATEALREGEASGLAEGADGEVRGGAGSAAPAGTRRGLRRRPAAADLGGLRGTAAETPGHAQEAKLSDHDAAVLGAMEASGLASPAETAAMARVRTGKATPEDVATVAGFLQKLAPAVEAAKAIKGAENAMAGVAGTKATLTPIPGWHAAREAGTVGHETTIAAPGGSVPARYEVRELGTVSASHQALPSGGLRRRPVEEYPVGLQPRDYSNIPGEKEKVQRFAKEMVPGYFISHHPDATSGPPTITPDGTVVNGNGRQMALERATQVLTYPKYKADLIKQAAAFGIDPKAVAKMNRPVLYRVVDMNPATEQAQRFARAGNVTTTQSQSPVRTAASLSSLIDPHFIDSLRLEGDTTFSEAVTDPQKGKAFRDRLARELPPSEVGRYLTEEGRLTDAGTELVRNMLLSKVLPVDLVERMGEGMKAVKRTLEGAIPQLIKLKRDFPESDPTPALVEALQVWSRNDHIRTVADADNLLAQGDLFTGGKAVNISPNGRMMLDFLLTDGMKPLVFRRKLAGLVTDLEHATKGLFAEPTADTAEAAASVLGVQKREGAKFAPGGPPPGVFFHRNRTTHQTAAGTEAGNAPGPFEVNATIDALLGAPNYLSRRVPYDPKASAAALTGPQAIVTGKMAAGDPYIRLEEAMHVLSHRLKFEFDPAKLPPAVAEGFRQFFDPKAKPDREAMVEGLAAWAVDRSSGIAPAGKAQKAAAAFAESWAAQHGLTGKLDRIRDLFTKMRAQPAVHQAAGLISATGRPVEVEQTRAETVRGKAVELAHTFEDAVDNDLGALRRLERASVSKGNAKAAPGTSPEEVFAQTRFRDADLADEFERRGYFHFDEHGHRVYSNRGIDYVLEPWRPEDMKPVGTAAAPGWLRSVLGLYERPKDVSKAGVFMTARHVIDEAQRGRQYVSDEQLALFKKAMAEFERDPDFVRRATEAHDRATAHVFNDGLRMLAHESVHRFSPELVEQLIRERPTYVPLTRVKEEGDWQVHTGKTRGEQMANPIKKRMGSGEQILDPLVSIKDRYRTNAYQLNEQLRRSAVAKLLMQPGMGEFALAGEARLSEHGRGEFTRMKSEGLTEEQAAEAMRTAGGAEYFTHAPWPKDGTAKWYWAGPGGKMVEFRVKDRALYDLVTGQQVAASQSARLANAVSQFTVFGVKPLEVVNMAVRSGATSLNAMFQFRNLPRDAYEFWKNTTNRLSVRDLPGALKDVYLYELSRLTKRVTGKERDDPLLRLFLENRGGLQKQFAFDPTRKESAYDAVKAGGRALPIRAARSLLGVVKDVVNVGGAGELGPRYLEFQNRLMQTTGKTKAELRAILDAANKVKLTTEAREPIPYPLILDALHHAAEVTVPFGRQGVLTRELNRITPFFGPAVAGLSKSIRNWRTNPKGAAFAVAGMLGLRLLHWALFNDEDWFKELEGSDRYNNFVVPFGGKLYRLPGPRDLDVPIGGSLTALLDAAKKRDPRVRDLVQESVMALLPPGMNRPVASAARGEFQGAAQEAAVAPFGPLGQVGLDLTRNKDWTGKPIVPLRHANLPGEEKFQDYMAPYALNQLTGGRGELSLRGLGVALPEVHNAHRSVDRFYEELHRAEEEQASYRRRLRTVPPDLQDRLKALHQTEAKMKALNMELRGERLQGGKVVPGNPPTAERAARIRAEQLDLARKAVAK